jgi:ABC-type glycerol-3-phosphate transport system substrate-binding protein
MTAHSMSRRDFLTRAAVVSSGLVMAACTPKVVEVEKEVTKVVKETVIVDGTPQVVEVEVTAEVAPKSPIELRYLTWWERFVPVFPAIKAAYEDKNPHVTLKLEEVTYGEATAKYQTTLVAGTAADILYHQESMSRFYDAGQILDITDMVEADGWDYQDDFFDGLGADMWRGRQYGWTHMYESTAINYNKTMIQEYWGQDLWEAFPDGDWTWDDLFEVALACTKDTDGDGRIDQWGLQIETVDATNNFQQVRGWAKGVSYYDPNTMQFNLTSPEMIETLEEMWDWEKKHEVIIPQAARTELQRALGVAPFYGGKVALYQRFASDVFLCLQTIGDKFEWDSFPLPREGERRGISLIAAHPHNITAATKHKEEAYDFVKYMGTEPGLMTLMQNKMFCPPIKRPEIYETLKEAFLTAPPDHMNVWLDVMTKYGGIAPILRYHNCEEQRQEWRQEFERLWSLPYEEGRAAIPEFAKELEDHLNATIDYGDELPYAGEEIPRPGSCGAGDCSPVS